MSQSADTADADADENVDVVMESICFSCPPTIKVNVMGPRDDIHVNYVQVPCGAFFQWDLSWGEHVNVTHSYVNSTHFWISTVFSCGLQYGSTSMASPQGVVSGGRGPPTTSVS